MDDALCLWALRPVGIDMAHDIMAYFLFPCLCHIIVNIPGMGFQLFNLLIRDPQSQLLLGLSQGNP